jgi:tol-pal system protein YbgF
VPRTLGSPASVAAAPPLDNQASDEPPYVGAPGGRQAGAPLDLGIMAEEAVNGPPPRREVRQIPGALPPPPPRNPSATGQQVVMAPTNTPKDEYDLAYGYVLRKDYVLAEEALRAFMQKYPQDRLAADASYWLGETLFQRQRYRDAAETFLDVSTKHEKSAKAPDALLRLGQSLAALKEKEAACATFAEIPRKYPRATGNVKQSIEREQKRVGCL